MMIKIHLNPKYESLRAYIEGIPEIMESQGTYIYGGRRNLIKLFEAPDGTQLNVKRFKKPSLINNIIYSTGLRKPKGERAFTYPQILLKKGIETPEAVAYIEIRNAIGLLKNCYFISVQCPYRHLLYEVGNAKEGTYEDLALAIAALAARMHKEEVLHQDFSPGNILWDVIDGDYRFSIVDINRMRFGPVCMEDGCQNFIRLWGPKRFIQLMVREYARLRGFNVDDCENITMQKRADFWKRYMKKREMEFNLEL